MSDEFSDALIIIMCYVGIRSLHPPQSKEVELEVEASL
jgi:hypothetical protein